ncbi:MAG: hypothetical protein IJN04_04360 [Clostridia bacterium]|nr:hypothetical protein [Clostridia bacterium]
MGKTLSARLLIAAVAVLAVIALLVIMVPRLIHRCDNCDTVFFGTGYYANDLSNAVSSVTGQANKVLCEECAAQEHALAIAFGKKLEEFRRPLFDD